MTENELDKVVLELKSVEQTGRGHAEQVLTYLKLKGLKLGFVLNFGANLMKEGIGRMAKGLPEENLGGHPPSPSSVERRRGVIYFGDEPRAAAACCPAGRLALGY